MSRPRHLLALLVCALLALPAAASADVSQRIKNGTPVAPDTFEWTVALVFDGSFADLGQFCGGTLVDAETVVTAAHCVAGMQPGATAPLFNPNGVEVVANLHDLTLAGSNDDPYIDVETIYVIDSSLGIDPDSTQPVPRDDVAVLKLAAPGVASPTTVPPVDAFGTTPADDALWDVEEDLEVSGWGRNEDDEYPDVMNHATVDRWADIGPATPNCTDAYEPLSGPSLFSPDDMLCALRGMEPTVIDSCVGDSGGPLTSFAADATAANGRELVGIVSWGSNDCNDEDRGGVYARVGAQHINDFITGILDDTDVPDPQLAWVSGAPSLTGTHQVGETVTCAASGSELFSRVPDEFDLRLRAFIPGEGWTTLARTDYGTDATPGPIVYDLPGDLEGSRLACDLYARETGAGGYGVASFITSTDVTGAPAPQPEPEPEPVIVPPTVPPALPPVNPPIAVPRDEGLPRTTRVRRRCGKRRRCRFTILARDTTTTGATATGIAALQVRLTSRFRCVKRGRRRTCTRRRTLTARRTLVPGRFRVKTPRLRRGRHSLRIRAIDGAGNREPRSLTYSFRLR